MDNRIALKINVIIKEYSLFFKTAIFSFFSFVIAIKSRLKTNNIPIKLVFIFCFATKVVTPFPSFKFIGEILNTVTFLNNSNSKPKIKLSINSNIENNNSIIPIILNLLDNRYLFI
jgi:hypothetical protein